jgi:quercetin dioxygenase-like cupin family protein
VTARRDAYQDDDGGPEDDRHPPSFIDGRLSSRFERRTVVIAPGRTRPYEESEWRDAIVVVHRGQVELRAGGAGRRCFGAGDILWLDGLPIRGLHNPGREPAVLVAVSRRDP